MDLTSLLLNSLQRDLKLSSYIQKLKKICFKVRKKFALEVLFFNVSILESHLSWFKFRLGKKNSANSPGILGTTP